MWSSRISNIVLKRRIIKENDYRGGMESMFFLFRIYIERRSLLSSFLAFFLHKWLLVTYGTVFDEIMKEMYHMFVLFFLSALPKSTRKDRCLQRDFWGSFGFWSGRNLGLGLLNQTPVDRRHSASPQKDWRAAKNFLTCTCALCFLVVFLKRLPPLSFLRKKSTRFRFKQNDLQLNQQNKRCTIHFPFYVYLKNKTNFSCCFFLRFFVCVFLTKAT